MVPGAQTNETLNIDKGSSVGVSGVYTFTELMCVQYLVPDMVRR